MVYSDIKDKRIAYNISQTKLAEYSGFSKSMISAWELGKMIPNENQIKDLNSSVERIIFQINSGALDIKKKKIQHYKGKKKNLPPIIKDKDDYKKRCANVVYKGEYANELSKLYKSSIDKRNRKGIKGIALFSGCGGMTLGFEAAGIDVVGHVEISDAANKIYAENFIKSELLGKDICNIKDEDIKEWENHFGNIDVIIGGPPCQGFSLAGKRNPGDERNKLYQQYVRIVSQIQPKVFVMENVALMTTMRNANGELFVEKIKKEFCEAGYDIYIKIVNAFEYGVPQSRERMILVGIKKQLGKRFKFPEVKYVAEYNEKQYVLQGLKKKTARSFRYATEDMQSLENGEQSEDPLHWAIEHPEHVIKWLKDVPEGHSAHENKNPELRPPSGFNTTYKRIMWDEPCSTISTNFSMISGCRNVHPQNTRALTIREAARAQSFPDEFVFCGNWGEIRKAIGNAVPPILAKVIADAIYKQIFEED